MSNYNILNALNEHVHGHEKSKKALIVAINRNKQRYYQKQISLEPQAPKLNLLLVGESGTGKTLMLESLAKIMKFPLVRIDATKLDNSNRKEEFNAAAIAKLIREEATKALAEGKYFSLQGAIDQTVVFVDEFDKLGISFDSTGNWNTMIQASLLTLVDNKGEFEGVTWIMAGAFSRARERAFCSKSIGFFGQNAEEKPVIKKFDALKWGIIPELLGRIGVVSELDKLDKEAYLRILHKHILPSMGDVALELNEDAIVTEAMNSGMGVRHLTTLVNEALMDVEFDTEFNPCDQYNEMRGMK